MYQLTKVPYESFQLRSGHYSIGATHQTDAAHLEKQGLLNGNGHGSVANGHHESSMATGTAAANPSSPVTHASPAASTTHSEHPNVMARMQHGAGSGAAGTQTGDQGTVVQHTVA